MLGASKFRAPSVIDIIVNVVRPTGERENK